MAMVTGTWLGYTSKQDRVVHRTFVSKKFAEKVAKVCPVITFTDGTRLHLTISGARPSAKRKVIHGYDDLIKDCAFFGVDNVEALYKAREMMAQEAKKAKEEAMAKQKDSGSVFQTSQP